MNGTARRPLAEQARSLWNTLRRLFNDRPVTAIELARAMGWDVPHETARRRVRRVVKHARKPLGLRICGNDGRPEACGYWPARSANEWDEYTKVRQRRGRFEFASVRDMREAATDRMNAQQMLFEPVSGGVER